MLVNLAIKVNLTRRVYLKQDITDEFKYGLLTKHKVKCGFRCSIWFKQSCSQIFLMLSALIYKYKLNALTRFGANVTNDSATGKRADAATARTSSSSSLRAVTIGSKTSGSKSSVRS